MQNEAHAYEQTATKMLEHQRHIVDGLQKMKETGTLPNALDAAIGTAETWAQAASGSTLEHAASLDAAEAFSQALQANRGQLDAHLVREADEYNALLGDLKKIVAAR